MMPIDNYRNHGKYTSSLIYPLIFEQLTEITQGNDNSLDGVTLFEGKLYASARIYLTCFDVTTKKRLWEKNGFRINRPITGEGDRVYITADNALLCLNAETGEQIWKTDVDYFPMAASENYIYCRDSFRDSSTAICYSKDTGKEQWRINAHDSFNLGAAENGIIVIQGSEGFHVCEEDTGKILWHEKSESWAKRNLSGMQYGELFILGPLVNGIFYVHIEGGLIAAVQIETGKMLWVYDVGDKYRMPYRNFVHDDRVYFVTDPGSWSNNFLRCLDIKTGELIYKSEEPLTPTGHEIPIMTNGYIIGGSGKNLSFFDVEKQEFVWRYKHKKKADLGYPIACNDQLICYSNLAKKIYWFKNKPQKKKKNKKE